MEEEKIGKDKRTVRDGEREAEGGEMGKGLQEEEGEGVEIRWGTSLISSLQVQACSPLP